MVHAFNVYFIEPVYARHWKFNIFEYVLGISSLSYFITEAGYLIKIMKEECNLSFSL
jgi:hypothetical protein